MKSLIIIVSLLAVALVSCKKSDPKFTSYSGTKWRDPFAIDTINNVKYYSYISFLSAETLVTYKGTLSDDQIMDTQTFTYKLNDEGGFTFGDKLAKTSSVDIVIFVNSVQYDKIK